MSESEDEPEEIEEVEDDAEEDEYEEEEDESEDEMEEYDEVASLQDEEVIENKTNTRFGNLTTYLQKNHQETQSITPDEMHRCMEKENPTLNFLTRFEVAGILGFRTNQLNHGGEPFVDTDLTDSYQIAKIELDMGKLPFIIERPMPNGTFVYVHCSDLAFFP